MEFANPFAAPGKWYKGQLHSHTTVSDGALDPPEVVRRYREAGYHFLTLTDHRTVTCLDDVAPESEFLLLLGTEMDGDRGEVAESIHVVAFGLAATAPVPKQPSVPEAIAWAKEHGGEALIAHPYWSGLVLSDLLRWEGHLGVEVFNTGCHYEIAKGYSTIHWDDLLARGRRAWGFAVDDSHHWLSPNHPLDTARAWVMVKAAELTREQVMASVRQGLFYSSWGPEIQEIAIEGAEVAVRTSAVRRISFVAQRWAGASFSAPAEEVLTEAHYQLQGHDQYVRIECCDTEGRWAWSNPIFLAGQQRSLQGK
jgi:hypothetical protein